tara:strand:+ start:65 stop:697 length:633 start_codon:yes stop_codon:yes gene_type:complete
MEQEITEHLREMFKPNAIILHGSRAVGREREHSDWDLFLIYEAGTVLPKNGRLIWQDQNIEYSHHVLPVENIEDEFGVKLQFGRVLHEVGGEGTKLLEQVKDYYRKPINWSDEHCESHRLWMKGRVDGMRDTVDQPLVFERYASDFYARITNYWYVALQDTNPKPIYLALEEIAAKDPEYFSLIERFVETNSRQEKVVAAEKIMSRCFGI